MQLIQSERVETTHVSISSSSISPLGEELSVPLRTTKLSYALLALIMVATLWFSGPRIHYGLPYLYDEDEAHHFNRIVQMLKTGDFNPHYFYKPALHFYLRLPVTALAFFKSVEAGEAKKLEDLKTRNRYGIAEYEFTASHPRLVKYNRAFSLLITLVTICLLFAIGNTLARPGLGLLAAFLFSISPPILERSTHIGVDLLMTAFILASALCSLQYSIRPSISKLLLASLLAGFAVATKYNAFPALILPLTALLLTHSRQARELFPISSPPTLGLMSGSFAIPFIAGIGFLLGAPYSLIDLPAFLNGAAFEIHHYKTGNGIHPGLEQLAFYSNWIAQEAMTVPLFVLSILGAFIAVYRQGSRSSAILLLSFPVAYLGYMSLQRVNYPRNMFVVVAFLCLFSAFAVLEGLRFLRLQSMSATRGRIFNGVKYLFLTAVLLCLAVLLRRDFTARAEIANWKDSREDAVTWIASNISEDKKVGLAGELWLPRIIRDRNNVDQFSIRRALANASTIEELLSRDYDYLIVPAKTFPQLIDKIIWQGDGAAYPQRIKRSPAIEVIRLR